MTVAICGGSASGKTTFTSGLSEALDDMNPVVLHQDAYFRDWSVYPPEERERVRTANHPDAVEWDVLCGDIERLQSGGSVAARRGDGVVKPSSVILVEGHLLLWSERLRDLSHLRLFLDVDPHERVLRRLERDVQRRGGDLATAIAWYRRDVIPNFPIYTEAAKRHADLVIPYHHENPAALATVAAGIRWLVAQNS